MENEADDAERTRPPLMGDLVGICRELNQRSVNYIVVGGMAINIHGFTRNTEDIDLLIETEDPKFDYEETKGLMESTNPQEVFDVEP